MATARWLSAFRMRDGRARSARVFASAWLRQPLARLVPQALAALAGSYAILALAYVSFKRIRYPFDLEWMEGGSLLHVERALRGAPIYTPPSLDWTPFIYTPLYWYVSAGFAKVMGLELFAPRLVSLLGTGVTLLAIYASVRRDGTRFAGFIAAALFAATFRLSGAWFDLARPDMLACAFGCGAIWLAGEKSPSRVRDAVTGLLLVGSVLSKQTWLVAACAVTAASVVARPRRAVWLVPSFVVPLVGFFAVAHVATDGWSTYYTLRLPFQHASVEGALRTFVVYDLARNYGPIVCLAALALVLLPRSERWFYGIIALGCLATALSARLHSGAYDNVLIPGYAALAILAGHAVARVERGLGTNAHGDAFGFFAFTAVVVQIASLHYDLKAELPHRNDVRAGKRLVDLVKAQRGEVWVPYHGGFCLAAKKRCHAHWMAIDDVLRGSEKKPRERLLASIRKTLASGRIAALVLDDTFGGEITPLVNQHYPKRTPLVGGAGPAPKTGDVTLPAELRTR